MTLSIRQSYEKIRTPTRTVRRGRDPNIPVALYQELDELTRRIDGLGILLGANKEAIAAAVQNDSVKQGGGTAPPADNTEPTVIEVPWEYSVNFSGSQAALSNSTVYRSAYAFIIQSATILVESAGGAVTCNKGVHINGENVISGLSTTFDTLVPGTTNIYFKTFSFDSILGNTAAKSAGQPAGFQYKGRLFGDGSSLQFKISSASPNARVSGSIKVVEHQLLT